MNPQLAFGLAIAESFGTRYVNIDLPPVLGARLTPRALVWSAEERSFLAENIGKMSDEQIGQALGRSPVAIKIKRQRWGLPAHSKRPGWLTGNQVAGLLGNDIHSVMELAGRGILPAERLPGAKGIIAVRQDMLFRWAVNPKNWCYFKTGNVQDEHLQRLIQRQAQRWDDEWWSPGRAAEYHGCCVSVINKLARNGGIPSAVRWGNWWMLRSDVARLGIKTGRGYGHEFDWSHGADEFLALGNAVGISLNVLGAMCHYGTKRADYRWRMLRNSGQIEAIVEQLPMVLYDAQRQMVFADWRLYAHRFPAMARAMQRFEAGRELNHREMGLVRGVLAHQMDWYGIPGPRMVAIGKWGRDTVMTKLRRMAEKIEKSRG